MFGVDLSGPLSGDSGSGCSSAGGLPDEYGADFFVWSWCIDAGFMAALILVGPSAIGESGRFWVLAFPPVSVPWPLLFSGRLWRIPLFSFLLRN